MRTARLIPPHVLQKPPDASTGGWSPQLNKFEQVFNDGWCNKQGVPVQ